jgi:hypothetical protein
VAGGGADRQPQPTARHQRHTVGLGLDLGIWQRRGRLQDQVPADANQDAVGRRVEFGPAARS